MLSAIGRALHLVARSSRDHLKADIEKLNRKLRRIQATIEEVEHREIHDDAVNLWLRELKYLASDAEDVLDEYHYEIFRCQFEVKSTQTTTLSGQIIGKESNFAMVTHTSSFSENISLEMIERIRLINSRFDEISRDREALQLTNEEGKRRSGNSFINLSSTSHLIIEDDIFGRSDDKDKIIELLFPHFWDEGSSQIRVIPIIGMGGIGKTTLAQMVYHDLSIQSKFDVRAWVYVSPEFDIIRLTKEIFEFVTGKPGDSFDGFSMIQGALQKQLLGKKMFLVLDDVWDVQQNDWEMLFLPLRMAKLVRVLVTSKNDAVTQAPHSIFPYRLGLLPEHECLKLLHHCAFGEKEMREKEWSLDIGRQIIKKCGGLPLAIKCIGRVLHYNKNKYSWRDILDSELWESDDLDPIFCSLKVSYYHLPPKLRDCFLFCSLFPKGCRLRKMSIVYMWMAQGFLQPKGRKRAEDIGEEYFAELQMRSFIVPLTNHSFCLHDVLYDLARSLSRVDIHTAMDERSNYIPDKIQHLYIKKGINTCQSFRSQWLRTLFNVTLSTNNSIINVHDIRSVRVLGLLGSNVLALTYSPLKHLRYLGIMEFNEETLPESLCCLYHLQTLKITHCHPLRHLPTNIANLVNLRYLHIAHVGIEEIPVMLWQVYNLQMLRLKGCYNLRMVPFGISNLRNLHILQLKSCRKLEELPTDTGNLIKLSLLDLSFSGIRTLPASIGLLKSTKLVLVGLPSVWVPGAPRREQNTNLVEWKHNLLNGPSSEDKQTAIVERPKYSSTRSHKPIPSFGNWEDYIHNTATTSHGFNNISQGTWMSSQNQSSIAEFMSSQNKDGDRFRAGVNAKEIYPNQAKPNPGQASHNSIP